MPSIVVTFKTKIVKNYTIKPESEVTIGRHPDNDIVIENRLASSHHAKIVQINQGLQLIDLNSTNGTFVNNDQVAEYQLGHQDWITIGRHVLIVDLYETLSLEATQQMLKVGSSGTEEAESTMLIERSDSQNQFQGFDYLNFLSDDRDDFELSNKMVTIGKNSDADIVISGFWSLLAGTPSATIGKQDADYFLDHVTGFILRDDLLHSKALDGGDFKLQTLRRDIITVSDTMTLSDLLEFLLDQRQQIALVIDEYGGTNGLVTIEDVVETLLGMEIVDEMDRVEDMRALARRQWEKRAKALGVQGNTDD